MRRQIKLQYPTFDDDDIRRLNDVLTSTNVVMGSLTKDFEERWSAWLGVRHSAMVNSGSSANLLMAQLLTSHRGPYGLQPGDEVLVPAVTWSTTLFPFLQLGLTPVLVDVDPTTFNLDMASCEAACSDRTRAVCAVHLLGNPAPIDDLTEFCRANKLVLLEDCCEASGATWGGKKVGSFGVASSFSFMFAHHMSTIEGGMVCSREVTDNRILRAARAHGWVRDLDDDFRQNVAVESGFDDSRFLFWDIGFNVRPTEIAAALGLGQLTKLDQFIKIRQRNFALYQSLLGPMSQIQVQQLASNEKSGRSNFAFGFYIKDTERFSRKKLFKHLSQHGIESRPLVAGNLARHPFYPLYCEPPRVSLAVSDAIHAGGVYLPNNQDIDEEDVAYVSEQLNSFFSQAE